MMRVALLWCSLLLLGPWRTVHAQYAGGAGRGDGAALPPPSSTATAIHQGGAGCGDAAWMPSFALVSGAIHTGGNGRGDRAYLPVPLTLPEVIFTGGPGRGDDAVLPPPMPLAEAIFQGGAGHGDDAVLPAPLPLAAAIFQGGAGRGDDAVLPAPMALSTAIFSGGTGRGDHMVIFSLPQDLLLLARAWLEGPYDGFFQMHDSLRAQGLIPLTEPYTALVGVINGGGESIDPSVLDTLGNGNVVDWMLIELRSALDPAEVVASRCALILQNGFIVDTDGSSPVGFFDLAPGDYHVALRHRNHLGVMSLMAQSFTGGTVLVDFTQPYTLTYGTESRKSINSSMALWAGDVNHDGTIKYTGAGNDRDPILVTVGSTTPNNVISDVYSAGDVNLDGVVKYTGAGNDRDPILVNVGSTTPNNVRQAQLP